MLALALLDKSRRRQYILGILSEEAFIVENMADVRLKRAEQDIETLRSTQNAMLDRFDEIYRTLKETRDIAAENRERLDKVEKRLERVEDRLKLVEEVVLENRVILYTIADHLDLTLEKPPGTQPD